VFGQKFLLVAAFTAGIGLALGAVAVGIATRNGDGVRASPTVATATVTLSSSPASTVTPGQTPTPAATPSPTPTRTPSPTPTPTAVVPPPLEPDMLALQAEIEAIVEDGAWAGSPSVAITDLQTGEMVSVAGDELRYSGCVMNLFVLIAVMQEVGAGKLAIEDVGEAVRETIRNSNPETARDLYGLLGDGDVLEGVRLVDALIREMGFGPEDVLLDHPPAYGEYSLGVDPNNYLTAGAMAELMRLLWDGVILDGEERDFFLGALLGVKPGLNYLLAVLPDEVNVGHKNGFFEGTEGYVDNDAGIAWFTDSLGQVRAYAITYLSSEGGGLYSTAQVAQEISRAAYRAFRERYP
jgi:hypothetical protein